MLDGYFWYLVSLPSLGMEPSGLGEFEKLGEAAVCSLKLSQRRSCVLIEDLLIIVVLSDCRVRN